MREKGFVDYIIDALEPFGKVVARAMFGGYGLYKDGVIFSIIIDGTLYFKVDDSNRRDYEQCGSEPFSYIAAGNKKVAMSYWEVPLDILEDRELLKDWAELAYQVSFKNKKQKKK